MNFKKTQKNKGAAMLISVVFFLFISLAIISGLVSPSLREFRNANVSLNSKRSYFLAESGSEDVLYRLKNNLAVSDTEILNLDNGTTATVTTNTPVGKKVISTSANDNYVRKVQTNVILGTGASFNYGIQSGQGGFVLENSASVSGNVYSSGSVTGSGNLIDGDAVSAGPAGFIDNIHTTGSAYAHTIEDSDVDVNAYYVVKTRTTVDVTSFPESPDQPLAEMPISDEQISELEEAALAGGIATCSGGEYEITTTKALGPIKIPCDLEISGDPTVTLEGSVWVTGNVYFKNTAIIRTSPGLGGSSVAIIADNPSNKISSSKIDLSNSVQFFGSGSAGSFIFLISQNNSAELGGSEEAISMDNSSSGAVILYASHGLVAINNSATLKEVTGYKIKAKNSAIITYDTGLVNTLFSFGPGGGYEILDWKEDQ